jgi:invasion protein IalB
MSALHAFRPWLLAGAATLALAQTANAQTNRQFQDWTVNCPKPDACVATSDGVGARLIVGPGNPDRRLRLVILVAAGTAEKTPIALRLDDGTTVQLAVNACNDAHCQAIVRPDMVGEVLDKLRRQFDALVAYQSNDQVVLQPVSLRGMNAAVATLQ